MTILHHTFYNDYSVIYLFALSISYKPKFSKNLKMKIQIVVNQKTWKFKTEFGIIFVQPHTLLKEKNNENNGLHLGLRLSFGIA